ncbi:MAG: hypothetical protein ACLFN3_09545 [Halochromatium sp.]
MSADTKGRDLFIVDNSRSGWTGLRYLDEWCGIARAFDIDTKALAEFFRGHEPTATEWEESRSRMFPSLDRDQQEAYWALMKIARQHGGWPGNFAASDAGETGGAAR